MMLPQLLLELLTLIPAGTLREGVPLERLLCLPVLLVHLAHPLSEDLRLEVPGRHLRPKLPARLHLPVPDALELLTQPALLSQVLVALLAQPAHVLGRGLAPRVGLGSLALQPRLQFAADAVVVLAPRHELALARDLELGSAASLCNYVLAQLRLHSV